MTAINFPDSPSDGDTHVVGGVTYTYNNAETKWKTTINSNAFLPLTGGTVSGNILMGGEIQHDGDTDTNIAFDTDTILFDTAGSERFRVGSAGQLGIGGATYGTSGQVLTSGGASAAPSWAAATNLTRSTVVSTSSGSEVDFTGIPSGVRRITILLNKVSTNGTEYMKILIGDSGGFEEADYYSISGQTFSSNGNAHEASNGFTTTWGSTAGNRSGAFFLHNMTGNKWVFSGMHSGEDGVNKGVVMTGGVKALSGELTQVRITNTGSNTFDNGEINIFYEV